MSWPNRRVALCARSVAVTIIALVALNAGSVALALSPSDFNNSSINGINSSPFIGGSALSNLPDARVAQAIQAAEQAAEACRGLSAITATQSPSSMAPIAGSSQGVASSPCSRACSSGGNGWNQQVPGTQFGGQSPNPVMGSVGTPSVAACQAPSAGGAASGTATAQGLLPTCAAPTPGDGHMDQVAQRRPRRESAESLQRRADEQRARGAEARRQERGWRAHADQQHGIENAQEKAMSLASATEWGNQAARAEDEARRLDKDAAEARQREARENPAPVINGDPVNVNVPRRQGGSGGGNQPQPPNRGNSRPPIGDEGGSLGGDAQPCIPAGGSTNPLCHGLRGDGPGQGLSPSQRVDCNGVVATWSEARPNCGDPAPSQATDQVGPALPAPDCGQSRHPDGPVIGGGNGCDPTYGQICDNVQPRRQLAQGFALDTSFLPGGQLCNPQSCDPAAWGFANKQ